MAGVRGLLKDIGKLAERGLHKSPLDFPGFAIEGICRLGSLFISNEGNRESRLRGLLLSRRWKNTNLRIGRGVTMRCHRQVTLGNNVSLADGVFMSASGEHGKIVVGDDTHIDVRSVIYGEGGIEIGSKCAIASNVVMYSQTNQYTQNPMLPIIEQGTQYRPVKIGNDVWIGAGALILPGITIGSHVVVGAGSVVNRDVEDWKIVVGAPARVKKTGGK